MGRKLFSLLLVFGALFLGAPARAQIPGFTAAEVQTLGDLNFLARVKLNHTGPESARLYTMAMAMKNLNGATVIAWKLQDPDPGQILGFMADTPDGKDPYNRSLIDRLAGYLAIPVKPVIWPSTASTPPPGPIVQPPAPTPASGSGARLDSLIAALTARVAALEGRPAGSTSSTTVPGSSSLIDLGNGYFTFIARDNGGMRQGNVRGDFQMQFGINGYDGGSRILQNWTGAPQSPCANPALPAATIGMDSRGALSYNGNPCPNGTWSADQTYGQAFVIDGGWSQVGYDYATGAPLPPGILLASQRGGMDILFAVTPWRRAPIPGVRDGDPVLNKTLMRLKSDGSANPVGIVLEGSMRQLKGCNIGGVQVVCY